MFPECEVGAMPPFWQSAGWRRVSRQDGSRHNAGSHRGTGQVKDFEAGKTEDDLLRSAFDTQAFFYFWLRDTVIQLDLRQKKLFWRDPGK